MTLFKKMNQEKVDQAIVLYGTGLSLQVVANQFGVSRQALWDVLRTRTKLRSQKRYGEANTFWRGGEHGDDHANNLVEQAVEDGKLVRPKTCQQCGGSKIHKNGVSSIQAHHCDYNKPLDVLWLCQKCHFEWHKHNTPVMKNS